MQTLHLFRVVLLLLFLSGYHLSTLHLLQHISPNHVKVCDICMSAKHAEHTFAHVVVPTHLEIPMEVLVCSEQRHVEKSALDFVSHFGVLGTDFRGLNDFFVGSISLGYFSTAPPYLSVTLL